jgi:aryl-alcohol dehydrogenase-like predicted oxidoreductase
VPAAGVIGLGLAALGRPGYMTLGHAEDLGATDPLSMERRCHEVLDAAYAGGVRDFDAARSYGRSEEFLASWIRARSPAGITVSSKWGYTYTAGWQTQAAQHEVKDHSAAAFRRQLAESRAHLGEHLRIYQIHSVTPESPALGDAELMQQLFALRDEGLVVGLSVSGPRQAEVLERALDLQLFGCVQATWNVLEPSCGPMLARAHAAGLRVMIKEPLANGRLARTAPPALARQAQRLSSTPDAVALAVALQQPWASVVLSGAATAQQLEQNLQARALRLDAAALQDLATLKQSPAAYWQWRATFAWS